MVGKMAIAWQSEGAEVQASGLPPTLPAHFHCSSRVINSPWFAPDGSGLYNWRSCVPGTQSWTNQDSCPLWEVSAWSQETEAIIPHVVCVSMLSRVLSILTKLTPLTPRNPIVWGRYSKTILIITDEKLRHIAESYAAQRTRHGLGLQSHSRECVDARVC